jgi:AraC family transcriptional regulator
VERAKHFILENSNQDLGLSEIARHAYASEFHFSRLFQDLMCESPYQYLVKVRLNHAALLLKNTKLPVTEICFLSGFQSISHFSASFTRSFGLSPSRFRRDR